MSMLNCCLSFSRSLLLLLAFLVAAPSAVLAEDSEKPSSKSVRNRMAQEVGKAMGRLSGTLTPAAKEKSETKNKSEVRNKPEAKAKPPAKPKKGSVKKILTTADYLETFDLNGKRDPFAEMLQELKGQTNSSWWDQAAEEREEEVRFDGSANHISNASLERLPLIKVTGVMQVKGRRAVCAKIQDKGFSVLHENDRIVLDGSADSRLSRWLVIKKIHRSGMTIILDDGREITGKFY